MESSREDKVGGGRRWGIEGQRGNGTLALTPSWLGYLDFYQEACEVKRVPPACQAVNGGVLESE